MTIPNKYSCIESVFYTTGTKTCKIDGYCFKSLQNWRHQTLQKKLYYNENRIFCYESCIGFYFNKLKLEQTQMSYFLCHTHPHISELCSSSLTFTRVLSCLQICRESLPTSSRFPVVWEKKQLLALNIPVPDKNKKIT